MQHEHTRQATCAPFQQKGNSRQGNPPLIDLSKQGVSVKLMLAGQLLQPFAVDCLHDIPPVVQLAHLCRMPTCLLLQLPNLPAHSNCRLDSHMMSYAACPSGMQSIAAHGQDP